MVTGATFLAEAARAAPAIHDRTAAGAVAAAGEGFRRWWPSLAASPVAAAAMACAAALAFVLSLALIAFAFDFPAAERPRGRSGGRHVAGDPQRRRGEVEGARRQIRHPACRCHGEIAARQRHRNLCQSAVPLLEAWRSQEEQWRAAARCAGRAQGAHRGRLWPRRHADRCACRRSSSSSAIIPRFKANDFSGGIERGVDGIISVLTTDAAEWHRKVKVRSEDPIGGFRRSCFRLCCSC